MDPIANMMTYDADFAAYVNDAEEKMQAAIGDGSTPMTMTHICSLSGVKPRGFVTPYHLFNYFELIGIFVRSGFVGGSIGYTL